jgi:uncharacterized protein (TIGR03437 family)
MQVTNSETRLPMQKENCNSFNSAPSAPAGIILEYMRVLLSLFFLVVPAFADGASSFEWIQKIGSGRDSYVGLGTDAAGNSYLVGNTQAADFPVKSAVQPALASANATDVFIVKLDMFGNVVYATYFGGSGQDAASAVAVDKLGNVYVTGLTSSPDFPVTKGAYQSAAPPTPPSGQRGASFLFKLNAGGTLAYATYFSTSESNPRAIAVDDAGSAYITGTSSGGLPVTPGAYRSVCDCGVSSNGFFSVPYRDGFLARFDSNGSKLIYSTYIGVTASIGSTTATSLALAADGSAYVGASSGVYWMDPAGSTLRGHISPNVSVNVMTLAPDGSLYVAGGAFSGFQPTPGAAQPDRNTLPPLDYQFRVDQQTAIVKLDGQLSGVAAATYFGGPYSSSILSLAVDASGNLLVGGGTSPHGLPTTAPLALGFGSPGTGFAAELSSDLSKILFSSYFGDAENFVLQSVAAVPDGTVVLSGLTSNPTVSPASGAVWVNRVKLAPPPPFRIDSVVNAASRLDDPISVGATIVVRGVGFASDAQLLIGGTAVTPLAVSPSEITAVMPDDLIGVAAAVQVQSHGVLSNSVLVPIAVAAPGLFSIDRTGVGQGYILNEDGGLNGPDHPAQPGERITIFATGVGPVSFDDGYAVTANPVAVFVDIFYARGVAAYLGPVAGFPGDIYQLTVYVPTYAELVTANPDLHTFKYPPQVGVVLRIAGRSSQNGLAISIAQ